MALDCHHFGAGLTATRESTLPQSWALFFNGKIQSPSNVGAKSPLKLIGYYSNLLAYFGGNKKNMPENETRKDGK